METNKVPKKAPMQVRKSRVSTFQISHMAFTSIIARTAEMSTADKMQLGV